MPSVKPLDIALFRCVSGVAMAPESGGCADGAARPHGRVLPRRQPPIVDDVGGELPVQDVGVALVVPRLQARDERVDYFRGVGADDAERWSICHAWSRPVMRFTRLHSTFHCRKTIEQRHTSAPARYKCEYLGSVESVR